MSSDQPKINPIEKVREAISQYADFLSRNSPDSNEKIKIKLEKVESKKTSMVSYEGPEGKFTIKVHPEKQQVVADAKFTTGNFKATLTPGNCETKGIEPVFHKHWGKFHDTFDTQE